MEEEARDGQSVFLRGWGDYLRYSLKLTGVAASRVSAHVALRAWSPEALERRVAAIEATGLGEGWIDGDVGHGPAYRFTDPDGHVFELFYEAERYERARASAAVAGGTSRSATSAAAPRVKRLDHVNVLAADVRAQPRVRAGAPRLPPVRAHRARRRDRAGRLAEPLDRRARADLRRRRATAPADGCTISPSGSTRARSACAPPTCSSTTASTIEAAPSKHGVAQGFFLYGVRARRQPHRGHDRRLLRLRPRLRADRVDGGGARARASSGA